MCICAPKSLKIQDDNYREIGAGRKFQSLQVMVINVLVNGMVRHFFNLIAKGRVMYEPVKGGIDLISTEHMS